MNCSSCFEVKNHVTELLAMLTPILSRLNQLDHTLGDAMLSSDNSELSENSHGTPMDQSPSTIGFPDDASKVTVRPKRPFNDITMTEENPQIAKQQKVNKITLADLIAKKKVETKTKPNESTSNLTRSLYVSPFDPSTKTTDIMDLLSENDDLKQIIDSVNVISLASKRKNHKLTFVSFKIDIPRQHYNQIADSDVWIIGENDSNKIPLIVKEFIQKHKSDKKVASDKNVTANRKNDATKNSPKSKNTNGSVKTQKSRPEAQVTKRHVNKKAVHRPQPSRRPKPKQQNVCQRDCCPNKRPQPIVRNLCNSCTGHCGGNRYDSQPRYCN